MGGGGGGVFGLDNFNAGEILWADHGRFAEWARI